MTARALGQGDYAHLLHLQERGAEVEQGQAGYGLRGAGAVRLVSLAVSLENR
jgi:hypothetical protein